MKHIVYKLVFVCSENSLIMDIGYRVRGKATHTGNVLEIIGIQNHPSKITCSKIGVWKT